MNKSKLLPLLFCSIANIAVGHEKDIASRSLDQLNALIKTCANAHGAARDQAYARLARDSGGLLDTARIELDKLQKQNTDVEQSLLDDLAALQNRYNDLADLCRERDIEGDDWVDRYENIRNAYEGAQIYAEDMKKEVQRLKGKCEESSKTVADLQQEIQKCKRDYEVALKKSEDQQRDILDLKGKYEAAINASDHYREEARVIKEKYDDALSTIEDLRKKRDIVMVKYDASCRRLSAVEKNSDLNAKNYAQSLKDAEIKAKQIEQRFNETLRKVEQAQNERDDFKEQYEHEQRKYERRLQKFNDLKNAYDQLDATYRSLLASQHRATQVPYNNPNFYNSVQPNYAAPSHPPVNNNVNCPVYNPQPANNNVNVGNSAQRYPVYNPPVHQPPVNPSPVIQPPSGHNMNAEYQKLLEKNSEMLRSNQTLQQQYVQLRGVIGDLSGQIQQLRNSFVERPVSRNSFVERSSRNVSIRLENDSLSPARSASPIVSEEMRNTERNSGELYGRKQTSSPDILQLMGSKVEKEPKEHVRKGSFSPMLLSSHEYDAAFSPDVDSDEFPFSPREEVKVPGEQEDLSETNSLDSDNDYRSSEDSFDSVFSTK